MCDQVCVVGTGEGFLFSSDGASEWLSVMVRISQVFRRTAVQKQSLPIPLSPHFLLKAEGMLARNTGLRG